MSEEQKKHPLAAWFLGPKAEHAKIWSDLFNYIFEDYIHWRRNYFPEDMVVVDRVQRRNHEYWFDILSSEVDKLLSHLKAHYPFYSPRYIAHMLSEQSMPSVIGYFAAMLYNPNNVTDEAAPITVELELEAGNMISTMLGYDTTFSWAHLTSGGTIANLEAIWVARLSKTIPLVIQEYCQQHDIHFSIRTPNKTKLDIREVPPTTLLHLRPDEALTMPRRLARHLIHKLGKPEKVVEDINNHIQHSPFNINKAGLYEVYQKLNIKPVIIASEAAHYSIKKCANILGIGSTNLKLVPVDPAFRLDIKALKKVLSGLDDREMIIAVVGIAGTTEEGAIDPIHKILEIRKIFEQEKNRSFWFHIDAAWGGYIRTLLNGVNIGLDYENRPIESIFQDYQKIKDIREVIHFHGKEYTIDWKEPDLFSSILTMKEADSITVDPHKLGYIPYPAGVICFKNGLVTELIEQKALYISDAKGGIKNIHKPPVKNSVGPYIIEGSKPGAAAAATWLAHKTIPLTSDGHGQIIRTTLLNTQKLYFYLSQHKKKYTDLEIEINKNKRMDKPGFTFEPLFQPDTNVICFIVVPMHWEGGKLRKRPVPLNALNTLNRDVFKQLSIKSEGKTHTMPYAQDFFVSKTIFNQEQYRYKSIQPMLKRFDIRKKEYQNEGLFVLRSTVMNPWYFLAEETGINYLKKFVRYLHIITRKVLDQGK